MDKDEVKRIIHEAMGEYLDTHIEMYDMSDDESIELFKAMQKYSKFRNEEKIWECIDEHSFNVLCLGFYHGLHFAIDFVNK